MRELYNSMLEYYDELFPVEQDRIDFIVSYAERIRKSGAASGMVKLLDLGCATGTTAIQLMKTGMDVTGIDSNDAMIQSANRRNPEPKTNARFFAMDMANVKKYFSPGSFDIILCLGNTLAHLNGNEDILDVIRTAAGLLKKNGVFIFQLINYDRILDKKITELPAIETQRSRFVRKYAFTGDGHINFHATLISSTGNMVFSEETTLYPVTLKELTGDLREAGLIEEDLYSDFDRGPLGKDSLAILGTASK
ncbi:class I SAM-dependent methyltransferase [Breznakiella homolactica]|uniref:Class I SAM-dependent methyltransferase n=1 Tax=Breznakiella homolactica TaxID=2798577 RepID=A0A7T7XP16_9SPIR|nr:class I SAM-dependent methyltransferase [Breznakiella homolactica]QQO09879.1 class I SAM-dependent methyltransferase [Breznakiella homolactica]